MIHAERLTGRGQKLAIRFAEPDGPRDDCVRVGVVARLGIEREAIVAALTHAGFRLTCAVSEEVGGGSEDLIVVRESAGVRARAICGRRAASGRHEPILAICDSPARIAEAIAGGADGAVLMTSPASRVAHAIREIVRGNAVIPVDALEELFAVKARRQALDALEARVLQELAAGATDAEIGRRCRVSHAVVREIIGSLLRRFDAADRLQVVVEAHHAGFLE